MQLSGFPVSVSMDEALSANSVKWEEEKQAYLNGEKIALAEAINYFGSDVILDLTTAIVSQPEEVTIPESVITVRESDGLILASTLEDTPNGLILSHESTNYEVPHEGLRSHSRRAAVSTIAAEDITDIPAKGKDTLMVVDENGYLGSFLETNPEVVVPVKNCSAVCGIPISVINIMVREDPKFAQRCQILKKTLRCIHLEGLQIIERPDVPTYDMQTLTMGKVPNERGFRYFDFFGKVQVPTKKKGLSDRAWHYLHTLANKGIANRALSNVLRYEKYPGRRTKILYCWNAGSPKHELFPLRFSP